ncbi:MAG: Nif3-like dinuclear metal center hexameric protein [Bacteroidales bacterium]|nr:Nif3-like dinuclear metal center hexameric protein [Bacteroidales bacterium]
MYKISEILGCITEMAPLHWQESWDNAGLLVGDANMLIDKALVTLDVTESVIDEAVENGFHLVISHHPVIYKPLKHLLPENTIERTIIKAIKNDVAIACMHTNLDNSYLGVSKWLADKLGVKNLEVLEPMKVEEDVVTGGGMVGYLDEALDEKDFLAMVKKNLGASALRHSDFLGKKIKKVAVCGGSGFFLLDNVKRCNADAYVTADVKYHDFFNADGRLLLVDAGHYETEQFTKELIADVIIKKFCNFAVSISRVKTNSINYFV